jgi:hypothetical protein
MHSSPSRPSCRCISVTPTALGSVPPNENTNGLLRQYFPARKPIPVDQANLDEVAAELNGRPRKTLGFMTPAERYTQLLTASNTAKSSPAAPEHRSTPLGGPSTGPRTRQSENIQQYKGGASTP